MTVVLSSEQATLEFGQQLARHLQHRDLMDAVVFLFGPLGAGKTTVVRGLLTALGHTGAVKSPTYTLLEPYRIASWAVYHFDLYRVADPQELEFVGFDEVIEGPGLKLFEWPQRASHWLPPPAVQIHLEPVQDGLARQVRLEFC